jgi:predicted ATPase/DNA-binding winged helix-turn-helix (wHTH) protein
VLEGQKSLRIGTRAFDVLLALVERAGETVSNEELIARVWPGTAVHDANLRVQVRALRRALGDRHDGARYIVNVPLRGYCFVAPVAMQASSGSTERDHDPLSPSELPLQAPRLVGRAETVATLERQLQDRRLITIVGSAGTGKSAVALVLAERLAVAGGRSVKFIDLAPLADPALVPSTVASALRISLPPRDQARAFVDAVGGRRLLLVLDNCEHLIAPVAFLAEMVLRGAPGVGILATSREPLHVPGEWVSRLPSLGVPPSSSTLTAEEAMTFPAVELFVERASASFDGFAMTDVEAPLVAELCRRLDGLPLAIELAAAQAESSTVKELAGRLDDRLGLIMKGRRAARPRRRSLQGAMEWSYESLSGRQQRGLRLLAIFPGSFDVDGVTALTVEDEGRPSDALADLTDLIEKSLVVVDARAERVHYRLLATTRAYALEKLRERGELEAARRRHAMRTRDFLERAASDWDGVDAARWRAQNEGLIDDVRAAIAWAFSPEGDTSLGVALATSSVRCGALLSLHQEFRGYVVKALQVPNLARLDPASAVKLTVALQSFNLYTRGEIDSSIEQASALAESHGSPSDQEITLEGMWSRRLFDEGDYRGAIEMAKRHALVTSTMSDPAMRFNSDRVMGIGLHFFGDQSGARPLLERVVAHGTPLLRPEKPFQIDMRVSGGLALARVLWLQGFAERAAMVAERALARAREVNDPMAICYVLAFAACPIAIWSGETEKAAAFTNTLRRESAQHGLPYWEKWAECYAVALSPSIEVGLEKYLMLQQEVLGTLREDLVSSELVARIDASRDNWCAPEVLRVSAISLLRTAKSTLQAESLLLRSLETAKRHDSRSWELRSAASLARLWSKRKRLRDARELLEPVILAFPEGKPTADLRIARELLSSLHDE